MTFQAVSKSAACLALLAGMGLSLPAAAQSRACVNLLVGAGYSAWMAVEFAGTEHWSSSFPIGQTRCIELPVKDMVDGNTYRVLVSAALGQSRVKCEPEPSPYSSANTNALVYNAWGTTLSVKCHMPGTDDAMAVDGMMEPSEEGMMALEKHNAEGPMEAPE